ncbi:HAD-IA family hydrolase [Desulfosporosinus burensis]
MSIEAIVFDLDDTIYPEEQFVFSGFNSVDTWLKAEFEIFGFQEHAKQIYGLGIRGNIFDQALVNLGVKCDPELIRSMVQVYREHSPYISAYEDAIWALDHFQGRYKMGLITDGYLMVQRNKVKALDIKDYFDTIVFTDVYGRENWKPSLLPYSIAKQELGCAHHDIVYVGDNPSKDFIGAKKLGWLTVQVSRTEGQYCNVQVPEENYSADFCIESLTDLIDVLR